jgi:predicted unusual protein kinase regulating ubiquinone biosynthesis (AarF/ABC1/UbiB family)
MLVPAPYVDVFDKMCENAPRTDFKDVKAIVEEEFGCKIEDVYSYFNETPIGSASLA